MQHSCTAYLRRVKKRLHCTGRERRRLLDGLEAELSDAFPQGAAPAPEQIEARFGTPDDMARELETALDPERLERARKRRRLITWIGFALCVAVIAILAYYVIWIAMHDIKYIDTEIIYTN